MSDFSIDTILSKRGDVSNRLACPYQPFLFHSADGLMPSHCSVSYIGLHLVPVCVPAAGALTGEGFHFGYRVGSCCPHWAHQPQHHYCPGQAALGTLSPAPMGQMRRHSLAQKGKRRRRHRTVFTQQQSEYLETLFNTSNYPDSSTREKLAKETHLSEETIKVWFKNRRAKSRKQKACLQGKVSSSRTCDTVEDAGQVPAHSGTTS